MRFQKLPVALLGASMLTTALPAFAQEEAEEDTTARQERIVVTAQRREQNLQDVPLSVTAVTGDALADLGAVDITDVAKMSPNVTLEASRGTNSTLSAFIRGVGQQDPVAGFESGVGIYLDDVYLNRPQGAVLDIMDVERIEVLRGPQGTLYGRNTIGGAVKYVTKRLSDEPTLEATVNIGAYNQAEGIVKASTPVSENFRVGAALARLTRSGYGDNLIQSGVDNYNKDILAARVSAELDMSDRLSWRFSADYVQDDSDPKQGHRLLPGGPSGAPVLDDIYDTRAGLNVTEQEVKGYGASLVGEFEVNDFLTIKNILAYRDDESTTPIDFDSLPVADLDVPAIYENDQFSEELQFLFSGDKLNGLVGFYYLDANAYTGFDVVLAQLGDLISLPGLNAQTVGDVNTKTWSVFADFTYDFTDQLSLAVGGRYTDDERDSRVLRTTYIGGFSDLFGGPGVAIATTSDFSGTNSWNDFSPRVSLAYKPTPDHNLYATYSQGFKGGGFDPRGQTTAAPDLDQDGTVTAAEIYEFMAFDPEEVESIEVGLKSELFDGRAQTNIALFTMDYTDVQVPGSIGVDTNGDGVNDTFTGVTTNAGKAKIEGVEFDGRALLGADVFKAGDTFNVAWSLGHLFTAQYDEFIQNGVNIADQAVIQNTPETTASLNLNYTKPMTFADTDGYLSLIASASHRSESSQFEFTGPLDQDAFTLLDASLVWNSDNWKVGLHGKNLTDEEYIVAGYDFAINSSLGLENNLTAFYGAPRTWTLSVGYKY